MPPAPNMNELLNSSASRKIAGLSKTGPQDNGPLEIILALNRLIFRAADQDELIEGALDLFIGLTDAAGSAYVPLDRNAIPLEASLRHQGSTEDLKEWVEYLASPRVHGQCRSCRSRQAVESCPLLKDPFESGTRIYCFPLRLGGQEYGLISLFRQVDEPLAPDQQEVLQLAADQLTLALANPTFQTREQQVLDALPDRQLEGLSGPLLESELGQIRAMLGAEFAELIVRSEASADPLRFRSGTSPDRVWEDLRPVMEQVLTGKQSILPGTDHPALKDPAVQAFDLLALPLEAREGTLDGAVLVGREARGGFTGEQVEIFQVLIRRTVRLVDHLMHLQRIGSEIVLEERSRLAREIHDGLAQTLGYLKLQSAQLLRALEEGQLETLSVLLEKNQTVIREAYHDVREAIDGLQINPQQTAFPDWVQKTAEIFAESSGWSEVQLRIDQELDPPPEVQVQLIRILQEAFSNIRKHAEASQVEVESRKVGSGLSVEIRDNGKGFSPPGLDDVSRHGLQGMQDRADLIDADLRVESSPGSGTAVLLRWEPREKGRVSYGS